MAKFMLLLHDDPRSGGGASPEEMQKIIGEYVAWRRGIEAQGKMLGGEKLGDEGGRVLSQANGEVRVVDGPFAEAKEVVGGFFMIEAADYDEAVALSQDCPHLVYGSRIELRQIDEIDH